MRAAIFILLLLVLPARADLLAGVAEADVTPEVGTPLAGYGGRLRKELPDLDPTNSHVLHQPSTGVRDPIEAQALVLQDGTAPPVALVAVDAIGVEEALVRDVARAVRKKGVPLEAARLFLAASHTHAGPGAVARTPLWALSACDLFQPRVHRRLVTGLADVIVRAWAARRPAALADGRVAVAGATRNRRAGQSKLVTGDDVDARAGLLRVDGQDGTPVCAVLHLAVHGTCLDDDNLRFSADVPGALRREVKRRLGVPVLFLNGAEGDVAPSPGGERGLTEVPAKVAPAVEALWRELRPAPATVALGSVRRDLGPLVLHRDLARGLGQGKLGPIEPVVRGLLRLVEVTRGAPLQLLAPRSYRFTALRLGRLTLLGVPGEPITAVGRRLEAQAVARGAARAWTVGLANGHFGYVTTDEEYAQGGYEAWLTFHGPGQAAQVEAALADAQAAAGP